LLLAALPGLSAQSVAAGDVELTDPQKTAIIKSVRAHLRDHSALAFRWQRLSMPLVEEIAVPYCAEFRTPNGKISPFLSILIKLKNGETMSIVMATATTNLSDPKSVKVRDECAKAGYEFQ
jgi:hypothetical protein